MFFCCGFGSQIFSLSKKYDLPFQIMEEDAALVEVGPRFVLNLIKVFQGSFGGPTLFENKDFKSPNMVKVLVCTVSTLCA